MKIAIVTSRYPKENEPYNHMFVHVRALFLNKIREEVTVFVPSKEKINYQIDGINVVCDFAENIANQLEEYNLVYLHLLNVYPFRKDGGIAVYKKLLQLNIPTVMCIHGAEVLKYPKYLYDFSFTVEGIAKVLYRNFWHFPTMKKIVKKLNTKPTVGFLFPSQFIRKVTEENFSLELNAVNIIANGIDTELFKFNADFSKRNKILVLRPFEENKAIDVAIKTMKYLPESFTMDIYGKGKLQQKLQNLIDTEKLSERVIIKNGFFSRDELPDFFSNYGIFMSTTKIDTQGVIMCEAMAAGLLTCSNPVTAIPEFISDGETGILGETPQEIAQKIIEITNNSDLYYKITSQARSSMEQIAVDVVGKKELDVFRNLIKNN